MWITLFMGTTLFLCSSTGVQTSLQKLNSMKCQKDYFRQTINKSDAILYGMRQDCAILFATIGDVLAIESEELWQNALTTSVGSCETRGKVFFMVVDGVVEMFMAMWAHYDDRISAGNLRLIHVPDFTIALRPLNRHHILSQDGHISDVGNILLVRFSVDDDYSFNVEHTAAGDALYGYQRGNFLKDRIFLKARNDSVPI
uniref:Galectin n=1 Tax=Parascaris univalens TaxID=6257 RepID=A0A914ZY60_PARUN